MSLWMAKLSLWSINHVYSSLPIRRINFGPAHQQRMMSLEQKDIRQNTESNARLSKDKTVRFTEGRTDREP